MQRCSHRERNDGRPSGRLVGFWLRTRRYRLPKPKPAQNGRLLRRYVRVLCTSTHLAPFVVVELVGLCCASMSVDVELEQTLMFLSSLIPWSAVLLGLGLGGSPRES